MALTISPQRATQEAQTTHSLATVHELNRMFTVASIVVFAAVVVLWAVLYGTELNLRHSEDSARNAIEEQQKLRNVKLERELVAVAKRAEQVKKLVAGHADALQAFRFFEETVQRGVVFSAPSIVFDAHSASITIAAPTLDLLAQQLAAFEDDPRVVSVRTTGVSIGAGTGGVSGMRLNAIVRFADDAFAFKLAQ